jgi:hypothetical protein
VSGFANLDFAPCNPIAAKPETNKRETQSTEHPSGGSTKIEQQSARNHGKKRNRTHIEEGQVTRTYCLSDDMLEGQMVTEEGKPKNI